MSDSSQTNGYFLWHLARLLLTLAIIIFPIIVVILVISKFFWSAWLEFAYGWLAIL